MGFHTLTFSLMTDLQQLVCSVCGGTAFARCQYGNYLANLSECCGSDDGSNEMTPDELMKVLKRYLRESNEDERTLAARIGVNHHTLHYWLTSGQSPIKGRLALAAGFLRRVGYL